MKPLTKEEMKQIQAEEDFGYGTGIYCVGKATGDQCGTKSCICENHSGSLFCTSSSKS